MILSFVHRRSCDCAARLSAYGMEINRGGQFSQDKRSRAKEKGALILPLLLCGKNIPAHAQSLGVTDVESEIDLILARASMFIAPDDISRMAIRPAHRSSLGVRCYLKLQNQLLLLKLWP